MTESPPPIMLAAPVYGDAPIQSIRCFYAAFYSKAVAEMKFVTGDSLVSRARNQIAFEFLKSDLEALMFVDSDIIFTPAQITQLWEHIRDGHASIVAGLYPIKQLDPLRWCANQMPGTKPTKHGLIPCREVGTGFMMIHRRVFEAIIQDHPERAYKCDMSGETKHDLFRVGVLDGRYLSEDWFFCADAREAGFDVFADTSILTQHIGRITYPVQTPETFEKP